MTLLKLNLPKLNAQDKFYLLSSVIVPLALWWYFVGSHRYGAPKGAKP